MKHKRKKRTVILHVHGRSKCTIQYIYINHDSSDINTVHIIITAHSLS